MMKASRITKLKEHFTDPLRRNAVLIMVANGMAAFFGFIFWLIAARFYTATDVGLATALLSAVIILGDISALGFDYGIVRFLPQSKDPRIIINTCYTIAGLLSIIVAIVFVSSLNFWSPKLSFVRTNWVYILFFIIFACINTIYTLQAQVFIALRKAQYTLFMSLIGGLRLVAIMVLTFLGAFGIFSSIGLATTLSMLLGLFFLIKLHPWYRPSPTVTKWIVKDMLHFSLANYTANIFGSFSISLIPILIIGLLNPAEAAYYNIAWSISGILGMVTTGISFSLLAEGSHDPSNLGRQVIKALKFTFPLIILGIIVLFFFGRKILYLFGADYSKNSYWLMLLFALMYLPQSVTTLFLTVVRVQLKMAVLVLTDATLAILTIGFSYYLMKSIGLNGVGIASLSTQCIIALVVGIMMLRMSKISPKCLLILLSRRDI